MSNTSYGAWILKNDVIFVEEYQEHETYAIRHLQELFGLGEHELDEKITRTHSQNLFHASAYRLMFRLGFVRVVFEGNSHSCSYYIKAKLSKLQKEYVESASYVDIIKIYGHQYKNKN